jgi:hypothetical protein
VTELSSVAQTVLSAYVSSPIKNGDKPAIAAILRAAAEQIEDLYCESDIDDSDGVVFALRQMMLIANDLEAQ